jgi:uncharacterized damage-inducible protein DinB
MNADAFRQLYEYHFSENRKIWDQYIPSLTWEQFTQEVSYSHGSVRNQLVHILNADNSWFRELRGEEFQPDADPASFNDRQSLQAYRDTVEQKMRAYLAELRDEMLFEKPFPKGEDENLTAWQVLLHVVNHGTDHRAQVLRLLYDLGVKTTAQDYIFYVYDHP